MKHEQKNRVAVMNNTTRVDMDKFGRIFGIIIALVALIFVPFLIAKTLQPSPPATPHASSLAPR